MATSICVICFEHRPPLKACPDGHLVCQMCLHGYAKTMNGNQLNLERPAFACPVNPCDSYMEIAHAISDPVIKEQLHIRFTARNMQNVQQLYSCAGCTSQFILDIHAGDIYITCPNTPCSTKTCIKCRRKYESFYHTCVIVHKENKEICKCGIAIRKSEACNHITCSRCKREFCYCCNAYLERGQAWNHFCRCSYEGPCTCSRRCMQFADSDAIENFRKEFVKNEFENGRGEALEPAHVLKVFPSRYEQIKHLLHDPVVPRTRAERRRSSEEDRPVAAPQPVIPVNRRVRGYPRMRTGGWAPRAPPHVRARVRAANAPQEESSVRPRVRADNAEQEESPVCPRLRAANAQQEEIPVITISDSSSSSEAEDAEIHFRRASAAASPARSSRIISNSNFIAPFRATMEGQRPSNCRCPFHSRDPFSTRCMAQGIQQYELTRAAPEPRRRRPPAALATSSRRGPTDATNAIAPTAETGPAASTGPAAPTGSASPPATIRRRKRRHATNWYN